MVCEPSVALEVLQEVNLTGILHSIACPCRFNQVQHVLTACCLLFIHFREQNAAGPDDKPANDAYLQQKLLYDGDKLLDADGELQTVPCREGGRPSVDALHAVRLGACCMCMGGEAADLVCQAYCS